MNSLEAFDKEIKNISRISNALGVNIHAKKLFSWTLVCCITVILTGLSSAFYTVYIVEFDFILTLKCISASSQAVVGSAKLISTATARTQIVALFAFLRTLYVGNAKNLSSRRSKVMDTSAKNCSFMIKCGWIMFLFILLIICVYPAYSIIYLKKPGFFVEMYFIGYPLNDETTLQGYVFNYVSQFIEVSYSFIGNAVYDLLFMTLVLHLHTLIELQMIAFDECEEMIGTQSKMFDKALRNCLIMTQDINNYILALKRFFSPVVFVQITSAAVTMGLSLFSIFTTDWLGAYGLFLMGFIQVLLYCVLGTVLEVLSERLAGMIYDFRWYSASVRNQKMILIALMKVQTPAKLYVGNLAELNVNTAASIFRMIYSYLMMLLNFVN